LENAKAVLPNKVILHGKTAYWSESEVTLILDRMKNNDYSLSQVGPTAIVKTAETSLTPKLELAKQIEIARTLPKHEKAMLSLAVERLLREELESENRELKATVQGLTPKAEFFDAVAGSKDAVEVGIVAKVLNLPFGRTTLFATLRKMKVLQYNNIPYQEYIDRGYFRVIEQKYTMPNGDTRVNFKTLVYQKGLDFIRKKLSITNTPSEQPAQVS
jgi:phage antirepressor YoqD-like protein